jgi:hypothetical protein
MSPQEVVLAGLAILFIAARIVLTIQRRRRRCACGHDRHDHGSADPHSGSECSRWKLE